MSFLSSLPPALAIGAVSASLLVANSAGEGSPTAAAFETQASEATPVQFQEGLYQVPYNGSFTFTRVRYNAVSGSGESGRGRGFRGWGQSNAWNHDYPGADRNLQLLISEYTFLRSNTRGSNVLDLEDPRIFHHPILYMSEPGYWNATDEGIRNLRAYLLKGGFLIFDDFEMEQWDNMAYQLSLALPESDWVEIDGTHPIFRSFYLFEDIYVPHPLVSVKPDYQAIFEENDPTKRIMVLANHNSDLAEYWEWSARGIFGMAPTNDAYRLGVNYIIYGVTH